LYTGYNHFYPENGTNDMVRTGKLAYGFDILNQWLISPKIHIPNHDNAALSFWGKMLNPGRQCKVYLSFTDTLRSSFTNELSTIAPSNTNWTEYVYSLRPYKNTSVYLGFKFNQSQGYIVLDDLTISRPKVVIATKSILPESHKLLNIYPNPFNPRTAISYQLSAIGNVELNIYDLRGNRVHTLINEICETGDYELSWDASAFSSGIYICALTINNELQATHKMVLVK
jgi:hypothetical protein